ncbi:hypothetical protein N7492_000895 [Penicillium capsulatum]|uniref:Protein kinase domain-containing protein n=1 Tax=Penicillium capsulatum TaxID=69766 RepID=A0A9W9LZU9_9EURO|nr:hypothetical protein N7492_000895 [Penicillium capsulatum]KAJ6130048.1 hypothetical protein N7512_002828 [Penicillium capsulatum]
MSELPTSYRGTVFPRGADFRTVAHREPPIESTSPPGQLVQNAEHITKPLVWNGTVPGSSSFFPSPEKRSLEEDRHPGKRQEVTFCKTSSPWATYKRFVALGTSGTTYLAQGPASSLDIVVCREERISEAGMTRNLISTSHPNVVQLMDAFADFNIMFMVYERMEISLPRLRSSAQLEKVHIATICKEVLHGLLYIHRDLDVAYTGLLYENVFLDLSGSVKIGNFGTSLIAGNKTQYRSNSRSVGVLLLYIMQPGTMCRHPDETSVCHPEKWDSSMVQFQKATETSSIEEILNVSDSRDGRNDGEPPILNLPDNLKIRVLHGEHRMRAAERFLEPREKWWVVMLYTPQLGETTKDAIQEEYSHQLKFTDGEIYRNIRLHASRQDTRRVKKWEARLSSSKRDVLSSLDKRPNRQIRDGFNKICHLVDYAMLSRLGPLNGFYRCVVLRVYEIWEFFMQDQHLFGLIDPQTINQLETLTPEASHDALLITKMMDKGEILPAIEESITREEIKTRILQHRGRILSFNTFFDDWKYMEALVKSLRPLLPSGFQGSLRDEFSSIFRSDLLCPGQIKIQTGEHRYRIERSTSDQQKWLSYLMIFLAAMRDFPVLSQTAPRKSRGEEKPSIGGSPDERLSYLAQLAIEIGFKSEEIDHLVAADPDLAAARSFLRRSRPLDRYEIDERHAFILSRHIAGELKLLATPLSGNLYPEFSSQLDNIPKQFRSGIPDNQSYKNDREHLYLDVIYNYSPYPRSHLTSLAFQRDIFVSYFGTMTLPQ